MLFVSSCVKCYLHCPLFFVLFLFLFSMDESETTICKTNIGSIQPSLIRLMVSVDVKRHVYLLHLDF